MLETHSHRSKAGAKAKKDYQKKNEKCQRKIINNKENLKTLLSIGGEWFFK